MKCPINEKVIAPIDSAPWFNDEILHAKYEKRKKKGCDNQSAFGNFTLQNQQCVWWSTICVY